MMISMQTQTDINFELMLNFVENDLPRLISYETVPIMFAAIQEINESNPENINKKLQSQLEVLVRGILQKHLPKIRTSKFAIQSEIRQGCCNEKDDYRLKDGRYRIQNTAVNVEEKKEDIQRFENITCEVCEKQFSDYIKLVQHLTSHPNGKKKLTCPMCKKNTTNPSTLSQHIQGTHLTGLQNAANYKCNYCKVEFCSWRNLLEHEKTHKKGIPVCTKCGVVFEYPSQLKSHYQFSTSCGDGVIKPPDTLPPGKNLDANKIGEALLLAIGPQASEDDPPILDNGQEIVIPKQDLPPSQPAEPLVMNAEGIPTPLSNYLKDREAIIAKSAHPASLGNRKYRCNMCSKAFTSLSMLNHHTTKVHVETKALSCTKCTKLFATYSELESHFYRIHVISQKRFEAPVPQTKSITPKTSSAIVKPSEAPITEQNTPHVTPSNQSEPLIESDPVIDIPSKKKEQPSAKREAVMPTKANPKRHARRTSRYTEEPED